MYFFKMFIIGGLDLNPHKKGRKFKEMQIQPIFFMMFVLIFKEIDKKLYKESTARL